MNFRKLFILLLFCWLPVQSWCQIDAFLSEGNNRKIFQEAEELISQKEYDKARNVLKLLEAKNGSEPLLNFRIGFCLFHMDKMKEANDYLSKAVHPAIDNSEFNYYYGRTLHRVHEFDKAIEELNKFTAVKKADKKLKVEAQKYIKHCQTGSILKKNPIPVTITNLGDPINTPFDEYVPLISSDESAMLFTYRGDQSNGGLQEMEQGDSIVTVYFEDIMMTLKDENDEWLLPLHLDPNVNSEGNDAVVAITSDAQNMFMFRSIENDPGSIYRSELDGLFWSDPELMEGEINSPEWDGSLTIRADGKVAYFASERKGGKGKRDLYETRKKADGTWGNIRNLGNLINTGENEDAPFLHPSGQYLVFSSDGHDCIGGFDIFVSELQEDSTWGEPINIGYPINSADNDRFYSITADGIHGYFASNKEGGFGGFDIYLVTPGLPDRPIHLAQVKGKITVNGDPEMARVDVVDKKTGLVLYSVTSNSATGKYLVDLPAGVDYKLVFDIGGYDQHYFEVDARELTEFKQYVHDVEFGETVETPTDTLQTPPVDTTTGPIASNDLKTIPKAELMDLKTADLVYRVQIGAYRYPWNFKYQRLMKLGKGDEQEKLPDEITRITLGRFETLREAYNFKDIVYSEGITDVFVTAIYKGKRYLLVDLGPALYEALKYEAFNH